MDRSDAVPLDASQLKKTLDEAGLSDRWARLGTVAGEEAAFLLQCVCRLDPAERILELKRLETAQAERGAGFLGMLPDQIPDDLPVPTDLAASLDAAVRLAEIRAANLEALAETMPQYELSFAGNPVSFRQTGTVPAGWCLDIDVHGIRAALDFFDAEAPTQEAARAVAEMPAFAQMIRHRRELGYVPEPLIDADGFAWCLLHAASSDPIDEIWKWLHPQNLFDLSDLHRYRADYRALIDRLSEGGALAGYILGAIAPYSPKDVVFEDTLSFAVGWGIRGWATEQTGGMNIEHSKDHTAAMLPTLVHETFHRLQVFVARPNPEIGGKDFDRITSYPFERIEDRRLYRALCYLMLEGSATFVASEGTEDDWRDGAEPTLDILGRVHSLDPTAEDDASDEILHDGLRSNGPFYQFGALLSQAIVEEGGASSLGLALQEGAPFFIEHGMDLLGDASPKLPVNLAAAIAALREKISP